MKKEIAHYKLQIDIMAVQQLIKREAFIKYASACLRRNLEHEID
jgi:hypothetical protein